MNTKVILKSNFHDYYDPWFDIRYSPDEEAIVLERFSNGGMDRRMMFEHMRKMGLKVPMFGTPSQLLMQHNKNFGNMAIASRFLKNAEVVGYTNVRSHRGEDKVKLTLEEALKDSSIVLCSQFLHHCVSDCAGGYSIRMLYVGTKEFILEYRSNDEWRSNCGDVAITILEENPRYEENTVPLYAIDFVPTQNGLVAVDYNIAPQVKGTGIEDLYSGRELANAIKDYMIKKR